MSAVAHFSKKETAMSVADPKTSLSVRDQVSKDEWGVRVFVELPIGEWTKT
jgi:hypothetical protein